MFKNLGPGVLVAAAFIGPGTITACTIAGVGFGYSLLWALLISTLATIVLQGMASRVGVVTQMGLAEVIKSQLPSKWAKTIIVLLILAAIVIGNAAYEAGNIGGATLGLEALFGKSGTGFYPILIGAIAFLLLWLGTYKVLEKVFTILIALMSISFLITAVMTKPNWAALVSGIFVPSIPGNSILTIAALVGTTVVPYNLFLHASLANKKWKHVSQLKHAKRDSVIAIGIGGLVSMAIVIAATAIDAQTVSGVLDLISGLEPLYGKAARYFMGVGLFAAGITSAITAPLATAFVVCSCFGWEAEHTTNKFRLVWILILVLGVFFLSFDIKPIEIIKFAQIANGILLPVIVVLLVWIVNQTKVMGQFVNSRVQNILGIGIILLALGLGLKSIATVLELL